MAWRNPYPDLQTIRGTGGASERFVRSRWSLVPDYALRIRAGAREACRRLRQERDAVRAALDLCTAERDEARENYRFMVERAADERLDGYRELGARAAAAEEQRDEARAELAQLGRELDRLRRELAALEWLAMRGYPVGRCPDTGRAMARYDMDTEEPRWFDTWADAARDCGWEEGR